MPFVFRMSLVILFLHFIHSGISPLHGFSDIVHFLAVACADGEVCTVWTLTVLYFLLYRVLGIEEIAATEYRVNKV